MDEAAVTGKDDTSSTPSADSIMPPKTRKAPAPVQALIGVWGEDLAGANDTFIVKAKVANDPKVIKDRIKQLGYGQYTIIVGRSHEVNYAKTEVDVFQKG